METLQTPTGSNSGNNHGRPEKKVEMKLGIASENPNKAYKDLPKESSLAIGAKTLAGIGIGLITVIAATTVVGVAAEAVLVPSLLLKLAGGIAGGGLGMAKGLHDERERNVS